MSKSKKDSLTPLRPIACIVIAIVVFFVFSGAMKNEFVDLDDEAYIQYNPMIRSLSPHNLWEMATSHYQATWIPLTWFSHAIDYQIFKLNPAGHHFTSIVLHCLNVVWVFVLFTRLAAKNIPAVEPAIVVGGAVAAILFGMHPLRVESVVWGSERKDILCAFFVLATYWGYLHYVSATDIKSRRRWYFTTLFLMLFALMSKSMAVTIPLVLLLLDVYPLNRWQNSSQGLKLLIEKLPFFALSLIVGGITLTTLSQANAVPSVAIVSLNSRIVNTFEGILFYVGKTIWPVHLIPHYPLGVVELNVWLFVSIIGVIGVTLICVWMWKTNRPLFPVTWFYYLITVSPVIGIIQVGRHAAADRNTYLPTLSFYFLIGLGTLWLWRKNYHVMVLLWGAIVATGLGYLTIRQTGIWKNSEIFWSYVAESYPNRLALADYALGRNYSRKGRLKDAEVHYKMALTNDPNLVEALNDLGLIHYEKGLYEEAENEYKQAMKIRPARPDLHNNLGLLYIKTGQLDKAKTELLTALQLAPDEAEIHGSLGVLYHTQGLLKDAEREYKTALAINPNYTMVYLNLKALYQMGLSN